MSGGFRAHLRGNVVGYLALFVALGGTAFAAARIDSRDVINNSLKSVDLKNERAVKGKDVKDGSLAAQEVKGDTLTGSEIDEASLEGVDAMTFDGRPRTEYVARSFISGPANRQTGLVFYAYTMVTPEAGTDYIAGQIKLRTTATPQEFQVCGATGLSDPVQYVLYIEGVRAEDSVPGDGCDAAVNFGDACDFEIVAAQGSRLFGAPLLPAGNSCRLLVLQAS